MSEAQLAPNLLSSDTIRPYRFVIATLSEDNSADEADLGEFVIGITTGATRAFDSANHAVAGDQVTLQTGNVQLVTVGTGGVTAGALVLSDAEGQAILIGTITGAVNYAGVALETVAAGGIARIYFHPTKQASDVA